MRRVMKDLANKDYYRRGRTLKLYRMSGIAFVAIALLHTASDAATWDGYYLGYWRHILNLITIVLSCPLAIIVYKELQRVFIHEGFFKAMFDNMEEGVLVFDTNRKLTYHTVPKSNKWSVIDTKNYELCDPNELTPLEPSQNPVNNALQGKAVTDQEIMVKYQGSSFYFLVNARPMWDRNNNIIGAVVVFHDITARREAQNALLLSEENYRLLAENASDLICHMDINLSVLYVSPSHHTLFGIDTQNVVGQSAIAGVHPEDQEVIEHMRDGIVKTKATGRALFRHLNFRTGDYIWLESRTSPVLNESGEVTGFVSTARDITARKQWEEMLVASEQRYKSLFEHNMTGIYSMDLEGRFTSANQAMEALLGYSESEMRDMSFRDVMLKEYLSDAEEIFHKILSGQTINTELTVIHRDGYPIEISVTRLPIVVHNEIVGVFGIAKDVTESKREERLLEGHNKILEMIAYRKPIQDELEAIMDTVNKQFPGSTGAIYCLRPDGHALQYAVGQKLIDEMPMDAIEFVGVRAAIEGSLKMVTRDNDPVFWTKYNIREMFNVQTIWSQPILSWNNEVIGIVSLYFKGIVEPTSKDIAMMKHYAHLAGLALAGKQYDEEIKSLAFHDSLTGLPNRRNFAETFEQTITTARDEQKQMALMFLDIDRFKSVNDALGHESGDRLLQSVAERLRSVEGITLARVGGDEFTVLVGDIHSRDDGVRSAQRILDCLKAPVVLDGFDYWLTTSIGIAYYPEHGDDATTLMKNADAAMYHAKANGRNTYQEYHPTMNEKFQDRLILESRLRKAIERDEFFLMYQPKADVPTGEVAGFEALIRWNSPDGMVPPNEFISLAEETGLIVPIGKWVIEEVCRKVRQAQLANAPKVRVSFNVSPRQFLDHDLIQTIRDAIDMTGADPTWLEVEITESVMLKNEAETVRKLGELRAMGIHVSIDDFGVGYSSLSRLRHLPINTLKIDRTFVNEIWEGGSGIVIATITMAHGLGLTVVAEGVETQEQWNFLKEHDCDQIQGYYFSRPLKLDSIEGYMEEQKQAIV